MTHAEEQARQLLQEAEKKMSPKGFLQSLFGYYRNRTEDAIECYQRAGNLFKLAKNWSQAGSAFQQAADLSIEQNNRSDAASNFVLASKCIEKYDVQNAIKCLLNAIQIYTDLGRFVIAAKLHNNIAEIYEQNLQFEKSIQHYEQAADYFKVEENFTSAKRCLLKVADYVSSEFKDYNRAIDIYQEVAFYDLKNAILQYGAKDHLFRAVLCHLCIDVLNAKHALDFYAKKYPAFNITREYKFLKTITEQIEEGDEDGFTKSVREYDDLSRLDTWHTKILLAVKRQISGQPDLL